MSEQVIKFMIGLMLIMVLWQDRASRANEQHSCTVSKVKDLLTADCSNNRIESGSIPQDLDKKIQVLDISRNRFNTLPSKSFKRYTSLVRLTMTYLDRIDMEELIQRKEEWEMFKIHIDNDIFVPLSNLQHLNISYVYFGAHLEIIWPASLQDLYTEGIHLEEHRNLHQLKKLVRFSAFNNALKSFPKFHSPLPTLIRINLYDNPIEKITVQDIAPLCSLHYLEMDAADSHFKLVREPFYCECERLLNWLHAFEIEGLDLSCFQYKNKAPPICHRRLDENSLSAHKTCMSELDPATAAYVRIKKIISMLFLIILVIILIAFILFASYAVHHRAKMMEGSKGTSELDATESIQQEVSQEEEEGDNETA